MRRRRPVLPTKSEIEVGASRLADKILADKIGAFAGGYPGYDGKPSPSIDMPVNHAEHVLLVAQGDIYASGSEEVSTSWQRSANTHGVNPESSEAPRIL